MNVDLDVDLDRDVLTPGTFSGESWRRREGVGWLPAAAALR
jgi:hypothetical protein